MAEETNPDQQSETPVLAPETPSPELPVESPDRRKFIGWVLGVSGAVVACLLCIPLVRESLYPVLAKGSGAGVWSDLGPADQYTSLSAPVRKLIKILTVDGWRREESEKVVYVTKGPDGKVEVLTAVCPHLGCEVAWQPGADHFHCPCHGGTFAPDGAYISGPPPRGMDTLPTTVKDGRLMVRYEYFQNLDPKKQLIG
ncbi:MAG: ubiquinol-cytochrome c reductase iron-sulfur subunit [Terriglobia bacterium]